MFPIRSTFQLEKRNNTFIHFQYVSKEVYQIATKSESSSVIQIYSIKSMDLSGLTKTLGTFLRKDWCFRGRDNFSVSDWQKAGEMRSLPDVFAQTDV